MTRKVAGWALWVATTSWAQPVPIITTLAGSDFVFRGDGASATEAQISGIMSIFTAPNGDLLAADPENHLIVRVRRDGVLQIVAGTGIRGFAGDGGPATRAALAFPTGVTMDREGNIYFTDTANSRVRRVNPAGIIDTVAGNGAINDTGDGGPALAASFGLLRGITADRAGNLFVADEQAHRIRRITPGGIITTVAGTGIPGFSGDGGPAIQARLFEPQGAAFDPEGNLLILDRRNGRIRRLDTRGFIATIAGGGQTPADNGVRALDAFLFPVGIAVNPAGTVLFSNPFRSHVLELLRDGTLRVAAGRGTRGFSGDGGPALNAEFTLPTGIAFAPEGGFYVADTNGLRIRHVAADGTISTAAGMGQHRFSGDGGPAIAASFSDVSGVAEDRSGNLYISDATNKRVRKISPNGVITTFAGSGRAGSDGDGGPATAAALLSPAGLAADAEGNIYIADPLALKVRRVGPDGIISTFAGSGQFNMLPQDGMPARDPAIAAVSVAVGPDGTVFILDASVCAVYRVDRQGRIFIHAGRPELTPSSCGFAGDGGPARNALLNPANLFANTPTIAVDRAGALYIADAGNFRVRRVDPNGVINTVAGSGEVGTTEAFPLTPARSARFLGPQGLGVNANGVLAVADLRSVVAVAQGSAARVAGNPAATEPGDGGPALNASLTGRGLAIDRLGNILVADSDNRRLRSVLARPPQISASPGVLRFTAAVGGAPPPPLALAIGAETPGLAFTARVSGGGAPWVKLSAAGGVAPRVIDVTVDPADLLQGTYFASIVIESPNANPPSRTISVAVTVNPGQPPRLAVDRENLSFTVPRNVAARSQTIRLDNAGGGRLEFRAEAFTNRGGAWLRAAPSAGTLLPGRPQNIEVTADPSGLLPGTYTGRLIITAGSETRVIPVSLLISRNDRVILLSQTGLSFTAVAGGGIIPPRGFEILNVGRGRAEWSVSAQTLDGGSGWLQLDRTEGFSDGPPAVAPRVEVRVNASGLAPGQYYAVVTVDAPGAANSPQVLTVFLEVLPRGSDPGAVVEPAELVFTTLAGRSPGAQEVLVYNIAERPKTFRSSAGFQLTQPAAGARIANLPSDAQLSVTEPNRILIQPFVGALPVGAHSGTVNLEFTDGRVLPIRLRVIVTGFGTPRSGWAGRPAEGCDASQLLPAVISLSPSAQVTPGWPVPLTADVRDDCGDPLDSGAVEVSFSNDSSVVPLQRIGGGRWTGTWVPRSSTDQVVLKFNAVDQSQRLRGEQVVHIGTRPRQDPPVVAPSSVVSSVSPSPFTPLAPGALISIYGERLAEVTQSFESGPLPRQVGATRVLMGGIPMAISFASPGQINAVVPLAINPDTIHQIYVRRGNTASQPVNVDVASAQPAVFPGPGGEQRQGRIFVVRAGEQPVLADTANPARAGDRLRILAAGLGLATPSPEDGQPAGEGAVVMEPVGVTVGDVPAADVTATLLPGLVGVYQVEAVMPSGVQRGSAVPVVVTAAGQASPPVTMAVD